MGILKYHNLSWFFVLFLMISCDNYETINESFDTIIITNWNNKKSDLKVELIKYKIGSNFSLLESKNTDFQIENNKDTKTLYLTPKFKNEGVINSDILLKIEDSLVYKFENIKFTRDTTHLTFTMGKRYTIFYKINAKVNDEIMNSDNSFIVLDSKSAIKVKK